MSRALGTFVLILGAAVVVGLAVPAQAGLIVQHAGVNDPTGEGFTLKDTSSGFRSASDPGWAGEDSWWTGGANGDPARGYYQHDLSSADLADMSSYGWRADARLIDNKASISGGDIYGVGFSVNTDTIDYELYLGTDASANPQVYQWTTSGTNLVASVSGSGYHTYSLVAAASGSTADLLVDGGKVTTLTGVTGTYSTPRLWFGSCSDSAHFSVNYSLVGMSTTTIPEPMEVYMIGTGILGLLAYAWRRRK
jgi:hypothetical protein